MDLIQAIILGIIEGVTEFLPVSSTGHLTIAEQLMGIPVDDPGVTAFTAIIQMGAIAAAIVYFWADIVRLGGAWFRGLTNAEARRKYDYRFGWYIIYGSIPIGVVGFLGKDVISGALRSVWVVAIALIAWSAVMWLAEKRATQVRGEDQLTLKDTVVIGLWQCIALIPGVSRSGATISAGLFRGIDRVTATRLSFFLAIPALTAAGLYEGITEASAVSDSIGWGLTAVATIVSFFVAYASIAWLLKLVIGHSITVFVGYRVGLGILIIIGLLTGVIV